MPFSPTIIPGDTSKFALLRNEVSKICPMGRKMSPVKLLTSELTLTEEP